MTCVPLWIAALALAAGPGADGEAPPDSRVAVTRYYAFHSDPWINLHHFLYQWSRAERGLGSGRTAVDVPERAQLDRLAPDRRRAWDAAAAFYVDRVAELDHFDDAMLTMKAALLGLAGDPRADPPDVIEGIAEVLGPAMAAYAETWWPAHDEANRRWIAGVEPDVQAEEERWVATVSRVFGGTWPDGGLRVDASAYGNWAGGYTSNGPPHTVVVSTDPKNSEGLYGLELVFHESGHVSSLAAPLRRDLRALFQADDAEEPPNLRHAMLFATAGEVTRQVAEDRGLPPHTYYVVDEGLVGFSGWAPIWPPVRDHWVPAVRGESDRQDALRAVVEAVEATPR